MRRWSTGMQPAVEILVVLAGPQQQASRRADLHHAHQAEGQVHAGTDAGHQEPDGHAGEGGPLPRHGGALRWCLGIEEPSIGHAFTATRIAEATTMTATPADSRRGSLEGGSGSSRRIAVSLSDHRRYDMAAVTTLRARTPPEREKC